MISRRSFFKAAGGTLLVAATGVALADELPRYLTMATGPRYKSISQKTFHFYDNNFIPESYTTYDGCVFLFHGNGIIDSRHCHHVTIRNSYFQRVT